jgi:hypothetical protein
MPKIKITGDNYKVTGNKQLLASMAGYLNMVALAIMFAGDTIFGMIGGINQFPAAVKDVYEAIKNNKCYFFIMVFFLSSIVQTQLMASGAFEIYINGNLEYSKLSNKAMPDW